MNSKRSPQNSSVRHQASRYQATRWLSFSTLVICLLTMTVRPAWIVALDNPPKQASEKNDSVSTVPADKATQEQNKTIGDDKDDNQKDDVKVAEEKEAAELAARKAAQERASRAAARAKGELTFDDLKFDIEKDGDFQRSMLTKEIEELDKKTIRIRGYILPQSVFKSKGFEEFVLVRDNQECCFGPGAALYDCIMVRMEKGKKADFVTRPVAVKGKFEIKEFKYPDGEKHYAIYQLIATEVK